MNIKMEKKRRTIDEYREEINELYKKEPYLMIKYTSTQLAEIFGVSASHMRSILSELKISFKKDIEKLVTNYPPYNYTYVEIIRMTKLSITRNTLNKYAKKICAIPYIHMKQKEWFEVLDDYRYMIEEYPYPLLQLKRKGIGKYLGIGYKLVDRLIKEKNMDIKNEFKELLKNYPLNTYTYTEIAKSVGVHERIISKLVKQFAHKNTKFAKSLKKIKQENYLYGVVNKEKRMTLKGIKKYFEKRLNERGYVTTKELREMGYPKFAKWLYTINQRYGLDVAYKYNKSKLRYERL